MGFKLTSGPKSLRDSLRSVVVQRMLYGVILLVLGVGLIVATTSALTLMPLYVSVDGLFDPAVSRTARFLIGAGFIAAAMVLFALANETQDTDADVVASPYSSYSYNT